MVRPLLDHLALQRIELQVEDLADVQNDTPVDLFPQVRWGGLNQRDLQRGDLLVHGNACQLQLRLEVDAEIRAVDHWGPPQREAAVWDLIETTLLRVRQLLEAHRLLGAAGCFPNRTRPCRAINPFEERVLHFSSVGVRGRGPAPRVNPSRGNTPGDRAR